MTRWTENTSLLSWYHSLRLFAFCSSLPPRVYFLLATSTLKRPQLRAMGQYTSNYTSSEFWLSDVGYTIESFEYNTFVCQFKDVPPSASVLNMMISVHNWGYWLKPLTTILCHKFKDVPLSDFVLDMVACACAVCRCPTCFWFMSPVSHNIFIIIILTAKSLNSIESH